MTVSNRAERLNGVTERRSVGLTDFEIRTTGNTLSFQGYASLFNVGYDMYGGPDKGGWVETVDPSAFARTLSTKPDVVLNINHGEGGTGLPLARTTSGTLNLRTDTKGLLPSAELDLRDPDVQALQVKIERGDVDQMSFAFRTIRQEWDEEETQRKLMEVSLDRGDVSIVTNGANPKTSVQLRGLDEAIAMLSAMDPKLVEQELRSMTSDEMAQVQSAYTLLGHLMGCCDDGDAGTDAPGMLSAATDLEQTIVEARRLTLAQAKRLATMDAQ